MYEIFFVLLVMNVIFYIYKTFSQHKFFYKLSLPTNLAIKKYIFLVFQVKIIYKGIYVGKTFYIFKMSRP